jgi:copper(I)-binding protein
MRSLLLLPIAALIAVLAPGCSPDVGPPLSAADVVISPPMSGSGMRAAYMTLMNHDDEPITLTSISSPQFEIVELHQTIVEDDVARMRQVGELVIPPRGSVRLEPGGRHLMMMRPATRAVAGATRDASPVRGQAESISLNFYSHGNLILAVSAATEGS